MSLLLFSCFKISPLHYKYSHVRFPCILPGQEETFFKFFFNFYFILEYSWFNNVVLLSHFSRVRLCATPSMATHQAPLSLGFSRQEHWSGLHFLLQCMKVKSEREVAQSCLTFSDTTDCSLPGSSIHGIFQARVLEWGAIAFSEQCCFSLRHITKWFSCTYPCIYSFSNLFPI